MGAKRRRPARRARPAPKRAGDLSPKPDNPRTITEQGLALLGRSMERFGDLSGIVYNRRTGNTIGGHQRLKRIPDAAKIESVYRSHRADEQGTVAVGFLTMPDGTRWFYREVDVDRDTEDAMNLRANNPAGQWEQEQLAVMLRRLGTDTKADLEVLGFETKLLERLLASRDPDAEPEEPPTPPPPKKPQSKVGVIYELGPHRLLCGDSSDRGTIEQAFGAGREIALVNTDPPYGVDYEARSGKFDTIAGDDRQRDALLKMLVASFGPARAIARPTAAWYVWHDSATRKEFTAALEAIALMELQYITWAKPAINLGWGHYRRASEPCFYAGDPAHPPKWYGGRDQSTVWRIAGAHADGAVATVLGPGLLLSDGQDHSLYLLPHAPKGKKVRHLRLGRGPVRVGVTEGGDDIWEVSRERQPEHPTQKPVALARRAILNSTKEGELVYDPFGRAGFTLLAAELTGRRAIVVELDPAYCDVIRQRYADLTGHAEHSPTGTLRTTEAS